MAPLRLPRRGIKGSVVPSYSSIELIFLIFLCISYQILNSSFTCTIKAFEPSHLFLIFNTPEVPDLYHNVRLH